MPRPSSAVSAASTESRAGGLAHLLTWAPLLALAGLFVGLTNLASRPIDDPDAWWHLRVGHQFWSGAWTLRETGPLSVFATEEWTPRDWIPQLLASQFETWFGLPGVAWLYGAALLGFLVSAYATCRREADPLPAVLAVLMVVLAGVGSLSQRPQMVSFIFMFVVVGAWLATSRDLRPRWWLVPLTWVWASCHGMWYCGVVVGLVAVLGLLLDRRLTARTSFQLASVPVLSALVAGLTIVGPRLWLTVFDTTGMWQFVEEWDPPSFREPSPAIAVMMIFVVVATWARRTHAVPWVQIGLLVVAVGWTLLAKRTVVLGAIVVAPIVAATLHGWIRDRGPQGLARLEVGYVGVLAGVCLSWLALSVPDSASTPGAVPNELNQELDALPARAPIINAYELGGWLHWRHPELQTVVDGFTDGYTPQDVAAYAEATRLESGWQDYVAQSGANFALLEADSPLAIALIDEQWTSLGADGAYVLLADSDPVTR